MATSASRAFHLPRRRVSSVGWRQGRF